MKSGIYTITNLVNGKMYVGYAVNFEDRWIVHKYELRTNSHHCNHLQRAVNKYGIDKFLFEVLVECPTEYLYSEEHYWCNLLNVHDRKYGYNIQPTHPYGKPGCSEETREKCRIGSTGRVVSQETRLKISKNSIGNINWKGKKHSERTKEKMRVLNTGKKMSEESKEKMKKSAIGRVPKSAGNLSKVVIKVDIKNNIVKEYKSVVECSNKSNITIDRLRYALKKEGYKQNDHIFKFKINETS